VNHELKELYLGRWPDDFVFSRSELAALAKVIPAAEVDELNALRYDSNADVLLKDSPKHADYSVAQIRLLKERAHKIMQALAR
jgi:hypothetical protein